jgi:general secretion pathway protein G
MTSPPVPEARWPPEAAAWDVGRERRRSSALTVVELLIIFAIVVTLAGLGVPTYQRYVENARVAQAIVDIRAMEHDILIHEGFAHRWPDSLDEIGRGGYLDPWRRPYQYLSSNSKNWAGDRRRDRSDNPLNDDFDLYSPGRDGLTKPQLKYKDSQDDVVRAQEGAFVGLASDY